MGRPTGSKNSAYDERRRELAAAVLPRLLADGGATSLNELAVAAGTSVPTPPNNWSLGTSRLHATSVHRSPKSE